MINDYLFECFLKYYYFIEAILGRALTDEERRKLFFELSSVFCLPHDEELEEYFTQSCEDHFRDITDITSYERFSRMVEFALKSGQDIELTDVDRMIMVQKREAMQIRTNIFKEEKNLTLEGVFEALLTTAVNGNIDAMATLSYMEYHGLGLCEDKYAALKRMKACAKWNNLFGNLLGIRYDAENTELYYEILRTVLKTSSQKKALEHICLTYSHSTDIPRNSTARLIDKAFAMEIIDRSTYDKSFAKIAFSSLISAQDKEKLLLTRQEGAIAALADIPFDVDWSGCHEFDGASVKEIVLTREDEINEVLQNVTITTSCPAVARTPLLIVSSDGYVLQMYRRMIESGYGADSVVEVDASNLTDVDLVPSRENVFLRGLAKTKSAHTVFVITHCDELEGEKLDRIFSMLDYNHRKSFKMFNPNVTLDLSESTFVLFANERNSASLRLSKVCDTVWAKNIETDEKTLVVASIFASRINSFGCIGMTMDEGCKQFLADYDSRLIRNIIDSAIKKTIFEKKDVVTLDVIKAVCKEKTPASTKRGGFGYIGGNYDAKN
ncbi:MAG: hypothetical protein IKU25_05390 [Clostridia bacterium]|nr:hypothetical protein [Clostridia bacterium]